MLSSLYTKVSQIKNFKTLLPQNKGECRGRDCLDNLKFYRFPKIYIIFGSENILASQKKFGSRKIWGKKRLCFQNNFGAKINFGSKKKFESKKTLCPKNLKKLQVTKNCWVKNNFGQKNIVSEKIFEKIFQIQKEFWG